MKNGPYFLVKAPLKYPGKRYRGKYVYEHHLVYWQNTDKIPGETEVIHHLNHNKQDNSFSNLELIDRSKHTSQHARPKTMLVKVCGYCGVAMIIEKRQTHARKTMFCCKKHQHLSMTTAFRGSSAAERRPVKANVDGATPSLGAN